ncbi:hypothetical protein HanIR_Chr07g0313801 [Helianthus annuus]|nr:hypothetical protein HanIR_Chr07g0313801 [Helianthus annuus]
MEAVIGSSSYLKLVSNSCSNFNNNLFSKPHPFHTIKPLDFRHSISSRTTVRPLTLIISAKSPPLQSSPSPSPSPVAGRIPLRSLAVETRC